MILRREDEFDGIGHTNDSDSNCWWGISQQVNVATYHWNESIP